MDVQAKVSYDATAGALVWKSSTPMSDGHVAVLQRCFDSEKDKAAVGQLARRTRKEQLGAGAQGELFKVPLLALRADGQLSMFEDQFRDVPWQLAQCDATLDEMEFRLPSADVKVGLVDVSEAGEMQASFIVETQQQLSMFDRRPATKVDLAWWMCKSIHAPDLLHGDKAAFINGMLDHLMQKRGMSLEQLADARSMLLEAAVMKIGRHRHRVMKESYQRYLLPGCETPLEVSPGICFEFRCDRRTRRRVSMRGG